jgi:hypothetical protein
MADAMAPSGAALSLLDVMRLGRCREGCTLAHPSLERGGHTLAQPSLERNGNARLPTLSRERGGHTLAQPSLERGGHTLAHPLSREGWTHTLAQLSLERGGHTLLPSPLSREGRTHMLAQPSLERGGHTPWPTGGHARLPTPLYTWPCWMRCFCFLGGVERHVGVHPPTSPSRGVVRGWRACMIATVFKS